MANFDLATVDVQFAATHDFRSFVVSTTSNFVYQHLFAMSSSFSSCFTTRHFLVAVSSSKERTRKVLVALLLISHLSCLASLVTPPASKQSVVQPKEGRPLCFKIFATSTSLSPARLRNVRHPPPLPPLFLGCLSRFFFSIVTPLQATGFFLVLEIFSYRITADPNYNTKKTPNKLSTDYHSSWCRRLAGTIQNSYSGFCSRAHFIELSTPSTFLNPASRPPSCRSLTHLAFYPAFAFHLTPASKPPTLISLASSILPLKLLQY